MMSRLFLACSALVCGAAPAAASIDDNKMLVAQLYEQVFNGHAVKAADQLLAESYIQHHPDMQSGRAAFESTFKNYFAAVPTVTVSVKRVIAEGDLVVVHSLWKDGQDDPGNAVVDIYRIADGRIAEHWDVVQAISTTTADPKAFF